MRKLLGGKRKNAARKVARKTPGRTQQEENQDARVGIRHAKIASPQSIGDQISNAYRTVVDTIKETDRLRNKLEPPAVSQTAASRRKFDASLWIRPD
jgi:hypothetical protein